MSVAIIGLVELPAWRHHYGADVTTVSRTRQPRRTSRGNPRPGAGPAIYRGRRGARVEGKRHGSPLTGVSQMAGYAQLRRVLRSALTATAAAITASRRPRGPTTRP